MTVKLDENGMRRIVAGFEKPLKKTNEFFNNLGQSFMLGQQVPRAFNMQGAAYGHAAWRPYSLKTIYTPAGTQRIKRGTDGSPTAYPRDSEQLRALRAAWGWGHIGFMRKGVRRYPGKLLQASGEFRKAFKIVSSTMRYLRFGLMGDMASLGEKIMSHGGGRNVLFVTPAIEKEYKKLWLQYWTKELVF